MGEMDWLYAELVILGQRIQVDWLYWDKKLKKTITGI